MLILQISNAEWGYLTELPNMMRQDRCKDGKTPDGRHSLRPDINNTLQPGVKDSKLMKGPLSGYGYARPWDDTGEPEELALELKWRSSERPQLDYYVAQRNGSPCPEAVRLHYPARMFVSVDAAASDAVAGRHVVLGIMEKLGLRAHPAFWQPCQVFCGLQMGGIPRFEAAIRADANIGPTWYDLRNRTLRELPTGMHWNGYENHGRLTVEDS